MISHNSVLVYCILITLSALKYAMHVNKRDKIPKATISGIVNILGLAISSFPIIYVKL